MTQGEARAIALATIDVEFREGQIATADLEMARRMLLLLGVLSTDL